jgi:hypothetical protein
MTGDARETPSTRGRNRGSFSLQGIAPQLGALGALSLAILAIAAALLISHRSAPPAAATAVAASQPPGTGTVELHGAFPVEPGPDGSGGQWLGDAASVTVAADWPSWIAFRAVSLRVARTLTITGATGEHFEARIATTPAPYILGPVPSGTYVLRPARGTARASTRDPRQVSVFIGPLRAVPQPVAALPAGGFWPTERAEGLTFNWLRDGGIVDVFAPYARARSIWLTFRARSREVERTITAESGVAKQTVAVGISGQLVRLGPFPVLHDEARILLRVAPGPRRYGTDPRALSVQVASLEAQAAAIEP